MKISSTVQSILLITFIVIGNISLAQKNTPLELGAIIPLSEVLMTNVSDEKMSLNNNFNENGLLVVFSCNTCPFVVMWEDRYRQLEKICEKNNIGMVYINSNEAKRGGDDSLEAMKDYAKNMGYTFPYLVDQNKFNRNKRLVYKGAIDDNFRDISKVNEKYLLNAIEQMVSGKDIKIKETKAKGCSIKRELKN